jgi:predicted porin
MYSISGRYQAGPFFAGLGYEQHNDYNPGAGFGFGTAGYTGGTDTGINVSVGYTIMGQARVSALYMKNEWEVNGAGAFASTKVKTDGYAVYLDWTIAGPHSLYAQYANVNDVEVDNLVGFVQTPTGAKVTGVAYGYRFSKRTQGYVAYNQLKNDSNANYSFGTIAASVTSSGSKQTVYGVGLRHSF